MIEGVPGDIGPDGPGGHRRRRRLSLLGLGLTGAGLAAVAVAVVAVVGVGQLTAGTACMTGRTSSAQSQSVMRQSAGPQPAVPQSAVPQPAVPQPAVPQPALSLSALTAAAGPVSGTATHYVLTGLPNCSYPSPPADGFFVALSPSEYDDAAACGGYLTVTGPDGSVPVQVVDQCPDCATGHIDLSEPAFAKLAPLGAGLINVTYQDLADPALPGPITLEVKSGSSPYWLALLADNTGNPLASVQVETASGGWASLVRASYNYWIAQSGAGAGPFTVRLTDTEGHQVTVHDIDLDPGAVQSTGAYMYGTGGDPAPSGAAPSGAAPSGAASPSGTSNPAAAGRPSSSVTPAAAAVVQAGAAPGLGAASVSPAPSATC